MADETPLTIVFGFRDREPNRVKRCLDSLAKQTTQEFEVLFIDYGSQANISQAVRQIVENFRFARYIYTETRGYPWNRAHALNIGIRQSASRWTMLSDIDMIYRNNFVATVLQSIRSQCLMLGHWINLPQNFQDWDAVENYTHFPRSSGGAYGGLMVFETSLVREIGGFDEYYRYWGLEDTDLHHRLVHLLDCEEIWLGDETSFFHQWHPTHTNRDTTSPPYPDVVPSSVWGKMCKHYFALYETIMRNNGNWGELITLANRPVMQCIEFDPPRIKSDIQVDFRRTYSNSYFIYTLILNLRELKSGEILVVRDFSVPRQARSIKVLIRSLNPLLSRLGTQINFSTNQYREFLSGFILDETETAIEDQLIQDYYLDFPPAPTNAILIRR